MWQLRAGMELIQLGFGYFNITSPPTPRYNCIAWAAGDSTRWWWPSGGYYWPGLPHGQQRPATRAEFVSTFGTLGFVPTANRTLVANTTKIALYEMNGFITHAARQLSSGNWTSKCGRLADIEHSLEQLEGPRYGSVVQILERSP